MERDLLRLPSHDELTAEAYRRIIDANSSQKLGLYEDDLIRLSSDEEVLRIPYEIPDNDETLCLPFLVPIDKLYWWNRSSIEKRLKLSPGQEILYYPHTPIQGEGSEYIQAVQNILDKGGVIVSDIMNDQPSDGLESLVEQLDCRTEVISGSRGPKALNQFTGIVETKGSHGFVLAQDFTNSYAAGVAEGRFSNNKHSGPSIESTIDVEDAERFWDVYDRRLTDISTEHPFNASYSKEDFIQLMQDPETVKMVYRVEDRIATLALFITSFNKANWLNEEYFKKTYPDAYSTNNILIFLGIVSDPALKGKDSHSLPMMGLITKVGKYRKSHSVITFECNDISSRYVPKIVRTAINLSTAGTVKGLRDPESHLEFLAIQK